MSKRPNPELIDDDSPEWTEADFARAVTFDKLPDTLKKTLSDRTRGPQKAPTKQLVSVRYSPEVIAQFKASGKGWQARMDAALQDWLKTHDPKEVPGLTRHS